MAAPRYLNIVSGVPTQIAASESTASEVIVATNSSGTIDPSFLPPGVGVEVITITASEALSAGAFVNIWNNSGTPNVRNANATTNKEAHGYVIASFSSSASATVYLTGRNTAALGGGAFTAGDIYLSTTSGQATQTAPSSAGNIVQQIGFAYSATAAQFNPGTVFLLA